MKAAILALMSSKKFLLGLVAILVWVVGKVGLDVEPPVIEGVVGIIALLITGQAAADFGKEAKQLDK